MIVWVWDHLVLVSCTLYCHPLCALDEVDGVVGQLERELPLLEEPVQARELELTLFFRLRLFFKFDHLRSRAEPAALA